MVSPRFRRGAHSDRGNLQFPMTVTVNDEIKDLPGGSTVKDLVMTLGLEKAACAVEVNRRLVPKAEHPKWALSEGDRIEVVTLVGGG